MDPEMTFVYRPIGTIHTPFEDIQNMPIQPAAARRVQGTVDLFDEFAAGLQDLDGFSHVILLYHFHRVTQARLCVVPFLDRQPRGVFATRAPARPNPIGLSVVRLLRIEGQTLHVEDVDVVNGTPLLDVKPYVPEFDHVQVERLGWLSAAGGKVEETRSDERFR